MVEKYKFKDEKYNEAKEMSQNKSENLDEMKLSVSDVSKAIATAMEIMSQIVPPIDNQIFNQEYQEKQRALN